MLSLSRPSGIPLAGLAIVAIGVLLAGCAGTRGSSTRPGIANAWGPVRAGEGSRATSPTVVEKPRVAEPLIHVEKISGPVARPEPEADDDPAPATACTEPLESTEPLYFLPYAVGDAYFVRQATCGSASHQGRFSFSYDFDMPRGTPVLAARDGVVTAVVTGHPEGTNRSAHANYVVIRHEDGESSRYLHLRTGGATVKPGDRVRAGDVVAYSGNSGRSAHPHLHFDVVSDCDRGPCPTIPATFLNTSHRSPRAGRSYPALKLD